MKTKKLHAPGMALDEECRAYFLPALLNFHKIPLGQFLRWELGRHQDLLYTLLNAHIRRRMKTSSQHDWTVRLAMLRRVYRSPAPPGSLYTAKANRMCEIAGFPTRESLARLMNMKDVEAEFFMKDGQVMAAKRSGFSYDPDDLSGELEMWKTVECPECSATEDVREDAEPIDLFSYLEKFDHLSGPYCRCEECGEVIRPRVSAATELPDEAYPLETNDEWDDYREHLAELLNCMKQELHTQGLPEPDGLRIEVSRFGWQQKDAYAECAYDAEELADKLRVNGQFSITGGKYRVERSGYASLSCVLSHHDGSSPIHVFPYWECEVDNGIHVYQEDWPNIKAVWLPASEALLCGPGPTFPYTNSEKWTVATREGLVDEFGSLVRQTLYAPDDEDIGQFELAVRLLADRLLDEFNEPTPSPGLLIRCQQFREVFDGWLETARENDHAPE